MELLLETPMSDVTFRSGSTYTIAELAELARRGMQTRGLTQVKAAEYLNEHFDPPRGRVAQPQISAALRAPEANPGLVLLMVQAFTDYDVDEMPRYFITRKG